MCENFLDLGGLQLVEPRGYELWLCRLWPDIGLGSYPRHTTLQHANVGTLQYLLAILGATGQLCQPNTIWERTLCPPQISFTFSRILTFMVFVAKYENTYKFRFQDPNSPLTNLGTDL